MNEHELSKPDLILPENDDFYEVHIWIKDNCFKIIRTDDGTANFLKVLKGMKPMQYIEFNARSCDGVSDISDRRVRIAQDFLANLLIEDALQ